MARIIFISEYLRGRKDAARLQHRTKYFATRPGVEVLRSEHSELPATQKQHEYIQRLVRGFPNAKELLEYEDFMYKPTRGNAQDFIEQVQELYIDCMDERENLVDYIANRPGVQTYGEQGLWDANGKVPVLAHAVEEVANHPGIVWTPVVSIRREDAERLGYMDAANWREVVLACQCEITDAYKIKPDNLRWYAAFHRKENQVHIHMMVFSKNPKEGYLTRDGIKKVKAAFARKIFSQDLYHLYTQKTEYRNELQLQAEKRMNELLEEIICGIPVSGNMVALIEELKERLNNTSGKKVYGYLPPPAKRIVDAIVDEIAKDERVAEAYDRWYKIKEEHCRVFNEALPERVPLSLQNDLKSIRNMVIREVLRLNEMEISFDDESMDDEPEIAEESVAVAEQQESVYWQADRYNQAKKILNAEDTEDWEKEDARDELIRLWNRRYTIAAHQLGKVYRDGLGVEPDMGQAELWFRRSAESGNVCSEYILGKLLLAHNRTREAVKWLEQAAEHDDQFARYRLGKLYLIGEVVEKDVEQAVDYLTASAEQNNQFAQYTLGKLYLLGREVKQDKEMAVYWLQRSADQGNTYAQYFLDHKDDLHTATIGAAMIRLLYHMSKIFRSTAPRDGTSMKPRMDRKKLKKLQKKKLAKGQKLSSMDAQGSQWEQTM